MDTEKNGKEHALFQFIRADETRWLFNILSDDRWSITCDGQEIASGSVHEPSIRSGVQRYLALCAAKRPSLAAVCG